MAPFVGVVLVDDIIHEKGGQCSFYSKFPLKSRFLLDFATKKQVVFDTTNHQTEVMEMILADKITEERKKNGWSQEELANQLGVSRQAVSKWESAGAVPDLQRILQMSELFCVSTDYLLKDEMKAENITYHESTESYAEPLKKVTMENANEFLDMKRNGSKVVANATSMCILSPILLIVLVTMAEDSVFHVSESLATVFGCVFLLGMVAAAVFLFITYGMRESHMEHFEKECFETEYGVSGIVREKKDSYEPIFIRGTAVGVVLCILAVIPTIIAEAMETSDYCCGLSVGLLLFILAIGVNLLVRVGMVKSSYDTLLQEGEYTKEEKLFKKKTDTFSGVYWCLTTAIYLAWSFWTMSWDITWIVWPVAGVLFAALLGVVKMVLKNGSETQHYI